MFPKQYGFIWTILCFIIMNAAEQQQGLQAASPLTHLSFFYTLHGCLLSAYGKAVCVRHGQTGTKWIHRRGESGSEETEGRREQALQYGPGENCTGRYMTCVSVCVCFTPRSIFQMGSCGHVYIMACPTFLFACGPPGINFKCCIIECNRCSPGGFLGHNHDVYLSF